MTPQQIARSNAPDVLAWWRHAVVRSIRFRHSRSRRCHCLPDKLRSRGGKLLRLCRLLGENTWILDSRGVRHSQEITWDKFPLTGSETPTYGQSPSGRGDRGMKHAQVCSGLGVGDVCLRDRIFRVERLRSIGSHARAGIQEAHPCHR